MNFTPVSRVLIIGTARSACGDLREQVMELGYDVSAMVAELAEAEKILREGQADLALVDLDPHTASTAEEILNRLQRAHNLPVVALSSRDDSPAQTLARQHPECAYLVAPCRDRELQAVLNHVLLRHQVELERRRMEAHMLASQRYESVSTVAHKATHDFNNILQAIIGNIQLASLDIPAQSRAQATLDQAVNSALRGSVLCKQFLSYAGQASAKAPVCELSALVRDSQALLRSVVTKGIRLEFRLGDRIPHLDVPSVVIQQILFNLAQNASDAVGKRQGQITISTSHTWMRPMDLATMEGAPQLTEGEYAYLEVADDAGGIRSEVSGRMFEPFFTTKFHGSGLGLSAVLAAVRAHAGAVQYASTTNPTGSCFRVYLPVPRTLRAA